MKKFGSMVPTFLKSKSGQEKKYILQKYQRSNQDTLIFQRPLIRECDWVQGGDILADCSTSLGGELSLGKNIFIAYMPWEGYNYEDAILISERLVSEDVYTSIHIESYEVETRLTKLGKEKFTKYIPDISEVETNHLDNRGIVKLGTSVKEGDILVGKVTPIEKKFQSPYEKFLYTILEKELIPMRDSSLRTPKGLKAKVLEIKILNFSTENQTHGLSNFSNSMKKNQQFFSKNNVFENPFFSQSSPQKILKFSHLFLSLNSWFFKKSSFSIHSALKILKKTKTQKFEFGFNKKSPNKQIPKNTKFYVPLFQTKKRNFFSFFFKQTFPNQMLKTNDVLNSAFFCEQNSRQKENFQTKNFLFFLPFFSSEKMLENKKNVRFPSFLIKRFTKKQKFLTQFLQSNRFSLGKTAFNKFQTFETPENKIFSLCVDQIFDQHREKKIQNFEKTLKIPEKIQVYLVEKRKIQVGDKMSGRHGNKGIVSQILPLPDMPFLPDGTPLDMVLNPLGVPSRMNVGQIYECILGLASKYLQQYFRIQPFDEIYGPQASRSFTFSKLYEARKKTSQKWLFNPYYPGKIQIFDGRTGEPYENPVTVGISYILKLVHLVDDKIHARSTGPYSLVTQQPLRGRSKYGGQRLGEMEVWAIEAYGAAFILLEMLTIKSDDISGRMTLWSNILLNMPIYIGTPESFKVLVCELQALCLDIGLYRLNKKGFLTKIEHLMQLP